MIFQVCVMVRHKPTATSFVTIESIEPYYKVVETSLASSGNK